MIGRGDNNLFLMEEAAERVLRNVFRSFTINTAVVVLIWANGRKSQNGQSGKTVIFQICPEP